MKQIITIATSNDVSLESYLKETKLSISELNELTKYVWELTLDSLIEFSKLSGEEVKNDDKYEVLTVETLNDKLN